MVTAYPSTRPRVLSVGEVLWDLLPSGPQMGGAPANFAFHAHALGADTRLISRIGRDALGEEILNNFRQSGLSTEGIQIDDTHDTGTVHVELTTGGQPRYHIIGDVAWDRLQATDAAVAAAATADAICFGTLSQRGEEARAAIRSIVAATPEAAWRICDINLREPFVSQDVIRDSLAIANVLKLNDAELPVIAEIFEARGGETEMISQIALKAGLHVVALTRGARGSLLWQHGVISEHPGTPAEVRDTIGAGDAFTAALAAGLLASWPLDTINARANAIAAFVCSQSGATPQLPPQLTAAFLS